MDSVYQVHQAPPALSTASAGQAKASPGLHEFEALGKKLAAPVSGLGLIRDRVCERHLHHFAWEVRLFRGPVPEAERKPWGVHLSLA